MRIIFELWGHVDWSIQKIEKNYKKIIEYLNGHKIPYIEDDLDNNIIIEFSKEEFFEFCSFISDGKIAPLECIHIPYEILCVNGKGAFEVIKHIPEGIEDINQFVHSMWQKQVRYPSLLSDSGWS